MLALRIFLFIVALCAPMAPAVQGSTPPTIFIGLPALSWSEIDAEVTPALHEFSEHAYVAAMSISLTDGRGCPKESWLTLGAGRRASGTQASGPCAEVPDMADGHYPRWSAYLEANADNPYRPDLGHLGHVVATTESKVVGVGRGGALALADHQGNVHAQTGQLEDVAELLPGSALTIIDMGRAHGPSRTDQLTDLDKRFEAILVDIRRTTPDARVVVASFGAVDASELSVAMVSGGPGLLGATSTQRPGLIHLTDLASVLPEAVGDKESLITLTESGGRVEVDRLAQISDRNVDAFVPLFVVWGLNWIGAMAYLFVTRNRPQLKPVVHVWLLAIASVPFAAAVANHVPWYDTTAPTLALITLILAIAAGLGSLAHVTGRWGGFVPAGIVATANLAVYLPAVITGSSVVMDSLLGSPAHLGARYFGMNNMMFAVVAVCSLILAGLASRYARSRAVGAFLVLAIGLVVTAVDGLPMWGADLGGPPMLFLAFIVLATYVSGRAITLVIVAVGALASVGLTALFVLLDYPRDGAGQTHLGQFAGDVAQGGAGDTIQRKLLELGGQWPFFILLAALIVFSIWLWRRYGPSVPLNSPDRRYLPVWLCTAMGIAYLGATFMNDSGVAIVSVGNLISFPLIISMTTLAPRTGSARRELPGVPTGVASSR